MKKTTKQFLIILYILFVLNQKSYIGWYPNISFVHPNSYKESREVIPYMSKDQSLFYKTDTSVAYAFISILPTESFEDISKVVISQNYIIIFFKYLINRPRPAQVNPQIEPLPSRSASTPAFPSGHSYQAFLVAKHYSKKYPYIREQLYRIAEQCGEARIRAGLHYPSDHNASKKLVDIFN
mgnify:FL=1